METQDTTSEASAETEADNTNADTNLSMEDLASFIYGESRKRVE